ncbi:MAG TPA: hypothetical protein VGR27_10785 [Longimicrobiaceae bacterium]|nr:hypothetical protein [Longimicrobiaceae bacterium]
MHLIQLLLPLFDNEGNRLDHAAFDEVQAELTERFGGVTAYLRSPARGAWKEDGGEVARDEIVIFEVMADPLDREWWHGYRERLERRFRQEELVVRALGAERL